MREAEEGRCRGRASREWPLSVAAARSQGGSLHLVLLAIPSLDATQSNIAAPNVKKSPLVLPVRFAVVHRYPSCSAPMPA